MTSLFSDNPQLREALVESAQSLWKPALAAALLGGAGTAWVSGKDPGRPGETTGERRRRILRNALIGAGLSGAAAAAIPAGARMLSTPVRTGGFPEPSIWQQAAGAPAAAVGKVLDTAAPHAGAVTGMSAAGLFNVRKNRDARAAAIEEVGDLIGSLKDQHGQPLMERFGAKNPRFFRPRELENLMPGLEAAKGADSKYIMNLFREAGLVRPEGRMGRAAEFFLQNRLNPVLRRTPTSLVRLPGWGQLAMVLGMGAGGQALQDAFLPR